MPRLLFSKSLINWQALILGAPESVPAGKIASMAESASASSRICPRTVDPICMTWEYFSIERYFSTWTVPNLLILPISFLPKSTSILCSASSLGSARSFCSNNLSSSSVFPLGLVPARGKVWRTPFSNFTRVSGEAPATSKSLLAK